MSEFSAAVTAPTMEMDFPAVAALTVTLPAVDATVLAKIILPAMEVAVTVFADTAAEKVRSPVVATAVKIPVVLIAPTVVTAAPVRLTTPEPVMPPEMVVTLPKPWLAVKLLTPRVNAPVMDKLPPARVLVVTTFPERVTTPV